MDINTVYNESNILTLERLPDDIIDLVVTSPPYLDARDYEGFDWDLNTLCPLLLSKMKQGGVCVWVIGDQTKNGTETGDSFRQALTFLDNGWLLHDTMIWEKPGAAAPSMNRYNQVFEYMFIFSKGKPTTTNLLRDKPNKYVGKRCFGVNTIRDKNGDMKLMPTESETKEFGLRGNVWKMNTSSMERPCQKLEHPATFSEILAHDHIVTWSNERDLIYDPFAGSGTTLKVADDLNRYWIGSEISEQYCDLIRRRLNNELYKNSRRTK